MAYGYPWRGPDITEDMKKMLVEEGYRTELDVHDLPGDDKFVRFRTVKGTAYGAGFQVNDDRGFVIVEEFGPGEEITWDFVHDELQLVLSGEAEITYSFAPLHLERKIVRVKAGQFYFIPAGAQLHFKILSKEAYRKFCVGPAFKIPYPGKSPIKG